MVLMVYWKKMVWWEMSEIQILTPAHLFQRVYYSYFERRHQDEAFEDEDNVVEVRDPCLKV